MYSVFNRKTVANYISQDGICKGYSIHSPRGVKLWTLILNCLFECFCEEFGDIKIINSVPPMLTYDFLSEFYGDRFYRIENRIPKVNINNEIAFITTDALPYLVSNLQYADAMFSTYTVVRPRSFAVKPYLREEFIRYFQFVIATDKNNVLDLIEKVEKAANSFFDKLRLSVVLVDRHSDSYYLKKSCFHSVWMNGNIESVLQCGILRKQFDTVSGDDRVVIDIGGAQRLLATFIYNNSDSYGLFLPHNLREYDVIIRKDKNTEVLEKFIKGVTAEGCRIQFGCEDIPLKKVRNKAIEESAVAIVAQRRVDGKEFLTVYNRDMTITNIYDDSDVIKWIANKYSILENYSYHKQASIIASKIANNKLYYKNEKKGYAIIENGLFN